MFLTYEQIRSVAHGAVRVEEKDGAVRLLRFSQAQQDAYLRVSPEDFYKKTFATAGMRLCFVTDSETLGLQYRMTQSSSRAFGWFDVYEDGVLIAHFGGQVDPVLEGREEITLSAGEKKVEIYFPWSAGAEIQALELADGSVVRPVKKRMTMLSFGDSITQGYDAIYPSRSYNNRLADLLDASCVNKAIGGDCFFPDLLDSEEDIDPDVITVAYGTNDWSRRDPSTYAQNCRSFYEKLTKRYPRAKILAITPIWRADNTKQTPFGAPLSEAVKLIEGICNQIPGITVIHGGAFTPRMGAFYSDGYLHPNDMGFAFYAENLYPAVLAALKR